MAGKKVTLDPDVVLEWLLDNSYIEETSSAIHPYRIAVNEEDSMPYTITFLSNALSRAFSKNKLRSSNRRVWKRELYKCLDEHQVLFDDRETRANYHWEFKNTVKKYIEQKLNIDLDALHEHDRQYRHNHKGGMRYTSYFNKQKARYGEERALQLFLRYFERRMEDLNKDCRKGKPRRRKFEED